MDKTPIINKIWANYPSLSDLAEKALLGREGAFTELAIAALSEGGCFLSPEEWLELSAAATQHKQHNHMQLNNKSLSEIGSLIEREWKNPYFGAVPYISALIDIQDEDEPSGGEYNRIAGCYLFDSARDIAIRFLSNATNWRGETARLVKAEIKRRLNAK